MKNVPMISSLLLGFVASHMASATEHEADLFTATSDAIPGVLGVKLLVDDAQIITGLRYYTPSSINNFDLKELGVGIVLFRTEGKDIIKIQSTDFSAVHGGHLNMTYLHDGLAGIYQSFGSDLDRLGDHWEITSVTRAGHTAYSQMYLKAKRFFGKLIGIDSIRVK